MRNRFPIASAGVSNVETYRAMHVCHRDYETRSILALERVGTHKYATDPCTEVLCCAYAVDDQPVQF